MRRVGSSEGIGICPETAICFDCLESLRTSGLIRPDEEVVVFNTAAAQKYPEVANVRLPRLDKDQPIDYASLLMKAEEGNRHDRHPA
jgi:threonine synthase